MSNQNFLHFQVTGTSLNVKSPTRSLSKSKNSPRQSKQSSIMEPLYPQKYLKSPVREKQAEKRQNKLPMITTSELNPANVNRKPRRNITTTQFHRHNSPQFSRQRDVDSTASNTNRFNSKVRKNSVSSSGSKASPLGTSLVKIESFGTRKNVDAQKDQLKVAPHGSSNLQRTRTFLHQQQQQEQAYPKYHKATTQKRKNSDSSHSARRHEQFSGGNSSVSGSNVYLGIPKKVQKFRQSYNQVPSNMRNGSLESLNRPQMNLTINNFDETKSFGSSKEQILNLAIQQTSISHKRPETIFEQQHRNQKQLLHTKLKVIQKQYQLKPSTRASAQNSQSGSRRRIETSKVGIVQGKAISPMPKSQKQIQVEKRHLKSSSKILKGTGEVEQEQARFQLLDQKHTVRIRQEQVGRVTATSGGFLSHMLHLDPMFVEKQIRIQKEKEEAQRIEKIRRELVEQEIIKRSLEEQKKQQEYREQQLVWKEEINKGFFQFSIRKFKEFQKQKELQRLIEEEAKIRREVEEERRKQAELEAEEAKQQPPQQQLKLGMQLSAPASKLVRQNSKRKLGNLKSIFNTTLALPVDPMKDKQQRLMGRLNKMLGEEKNHSESLGKLEKKKSWEDIPIMIGGTNFLTPEEKLRKEEEELEEKLKKEKEKPLISHVEEEDEELELD